MSSDSVPFITTLGQLNFIMWSLECGIVEYCLRHRDDIEAHHLQRKASGQMGAQKKRKRGKAHFFVDNGIFEIEYGSAV